MITKINKSSLLLGASTALMATLGASAAFAQVNASVVTTGGTSVLNGFVVAGDGAAQTNSADVLATIVDPSIRIDVLGAAVGNFTNSLNSADAIASANRNGITSTAGGSGNLGMIGSSATADGIALSTVSINVEDELFEGENNASIVARASGAIARSTLTGFTSGSVAVDGNSIDATTIINNGSGVYSVTLAGVIPVGYVTEATGLASATLNDTTETVNANGTLVASNVQSSDSSFVSAAEALNNTVAVLIDNDNNTSITATVTLDDNNIGAAFTGNSRTTTFDIDAASANFAGTAVIANVQTYDGNLNGGTNALNENSSIIADIRGVTADSEGAAVDDTVSFDGGSLSVTGNAITSSATGNMLVGEIALADALGYNSAGANTSAASIGGVADVNASGALVIASAQRNIDSAATMLVALTSNAFIDGDLQQSIGSSLDVSLNRITAAATGNSLATGIANGDGSAVFNGSVTLASSQIADRFDVLAVVNEAVIISGVGDTVGGEDGNGSGVVIGSDITMIGNIVAASATGNLSGQSVSLDATSLTLGTGAASLRIDSVPSGIGQAAVTASGAVTVSSLQLNGTGSSVSASLNDVLISANTYDQDTDGVENSITVASNIQQAFAVGGDATNEIMLNGTTVGSAAGIANSQFNGVNVSTVTATAAGATEININNFDITDGSAALTDNRLEALATGVTTANTLTVDAQTVVIDAVADADVAARFDVVSALSGGSSFGNDAAYAILNGQQVLSDVTAAVTAGLGSTSAFYLFIDDDSFSSSVNNDRNRLTAQAQAAVAVNTVSLDIGTLSVIDPGDNSFANVGSVMNVQDVGASANVLASVVPAYTVVASPMIFTLADGGGSDARDSSLSTSANRITALANGNVAANSLSAGGTTITVLEGFGASAGTAVLTNDVATVDAAFTVLSVQRGSTGDVTATLRAAARPVDTGYHTFADSALIMTYIGDDVLDSSIVSSSNVLSAFARSNTASNVLGLDATTLGTTAALANGQFNGSDVFALIGYGGTAPTDGSPAVPGTPFSVTGGVSENVWTGTLSGLSDAQKTAFVAAYSSAPGWFQSGDTVSFNTFGTGTLTLNATTAGTDAIPASGGSARAGGVLITVEDGISNSNLAVDSNVVQGSAIGNLGSNLLSIAATTLSGETTVALASAGWLDLGVGTSTFGANNDYVQTNVQEATGTYTSEVYSIFGIEQEFDNGGLTNSSLSVSGNRQSSEAMANSGTNSVTLTATDMTSENAFPAASLASLQVADLAYFGGEDFDAGSVSASSDMVVFANAASVGSSISLDNNRNSALGVVNNVANSVTVLGTNIGGYDVDANVIFDGEDGGGPIGGLSSSAHATFELANAQRSEGTLLTNATSSVYNTEALQFDSRGVLEGTVSLSGNTNSAESSANRAVNALSVTARANGDATSALSNEQTAVGEYGAFANTNVNFTLYGNVDNEALDTSSLTIANNQTFALARGNTAENIVVSAGGASLGGAEVDNADGIVDGAEATTVLRNVQVASGLFVADAQGDYGTGLAGVAGPVVSSGAVVTSSVNLTGNVTAAEALANRAINTMTVDAGATNGATASLVNSQVTVASTVTATAHSDVAAVLTGGVVGAEALAASGVVVENNVTQAIARGNVASNTMVYTAGATYGSPTVGAQVDGNTGAAAASVLNSQSNFAQITAQASNATYTVALNAGGSPGTLAAVLNSSITVGGNIVTATAVGNQAVNTMTLSALNSGPATAAVNNNQNNTGSVTATATSVAFGIGTTGSVNSGTMRNIGNAATATAVGNSAITFLGSR